MNSWAFIGRLGKDAEVSATTGGTSVVNFSVAVDTGWGENKKTMWVRCKFFGDRAKKVAEYIKKGDRIGVEGSCELETWDRDGKAGSAICCNVQNVTLLSAKAEGGTAPASGGAGAASQRPAPQQAAAFDEDLIPF